MGLFSTYTGNADALYQEMGMVKEMATRPLLPKKVNCVQLLRLPDEQGIKASLQE